VSTAVPRSDDLRLARVHLRCGAYTLARVELETLAGADRLDRAGILDLAEVRWRTGDLAGADAAASAWLEDGDEPGPDGALAHAISAEAAADRGAPGDAAAHVAAAAAGLGDRGAWEALLAGILPRATWPWSVEEPAPPDEPPLEAAWGPAAAAQGLPVAAAPVLVTGAAPTTEAATGVLLAGVPVSPSAAELVRAGAPLLAVAPDRAAILLALALRADRAAAEAVLAALDAAAAAPAAQAGGPPPEAVAALAFVRAEALRAAGRHEESRIAYASAERLALAPAEAGPPGSPQ
jgi:hypothetical protein